MNTKQIGLLGDLRGRYDFVKHGWTVCSPEGDYSLFDFIAIKEDKIIRVQVKTAQTLQSPDYVRFDVRSANYHVNKVYTESDCDYFYLFDVPREMGYLLPLSEYHSYQGITIRYTEPRNGTKGLMSNACEANHVFLEMLQ